MQSSNLDRRDYLPQPPARKSRRLGKRERVAERERQARSALQQQREVRP
ncbi:hypothetical protein [Variovorax sp. Sphag1AA]|nr:hypothetical protein [Variovorax sp. Sphag1AA]MBB3175900.1 hypothetical protein [Variovorax sp. Sphag1AA]